MRVLVTGGAGFIGSNLVPELARNGHEVVVLDDLSSGAVTPSLRASCATITVGSILDRRIISEAATGVDAIVHLAARISVPESLVIPSEYHECNVTGTLNVLDAAQRAGCPNVVFASSAAVYGNTSAVAIDETAALIPISPYSATKIAAEAYVRAWAYGGQNSSVVLRLFNVYGPGQRVRQPHPAVVPAFVGSGIERRPVVVFGDGLQSRDFTFVRDVVQVMREAVEGRIRFDRPINVASGVATNILQLIDSIGEGLDRALEIKWMPERQGEIRHSVADIALLRGLLPDFVASPLDDAIVETVQWYLRQVSREVGAAEAVDSR